MLSLVKNIVQLRYDISRHLRRDMGLPVTTERVTAYLPTDHVLKLKVLAEQKGVVLAHEFREAVKMYLEGKGE